MKKIMLVLIMGFCVFMFLPSQSYGSQDSSSQEDVIVMKSLTVVEKKQVSAEQNTSRVSISETKKAVVSRVPDVLDSLPGIDVQSRSILTPKNSQVRIRGLDERRSLFLLDGRPLNGTGVMGGYFVDWSMLAVENWEYAELSKGAFSAKYGNTLGGTVNLISALPPEKPELTFESGYKRYDTFSSFLSGSVRLSGFGIKASAGYFSTDGNLRNSEAERANFSGDFYYFFNDGGTLKCSVRYSEGDFNMPVENRRNQPGYDPDYPESRGSYLIGPGVRFPQGDRFGDNSYYEKKRTEMDLSLQKEIFGFDSELKLYKNYEEREDVFYSYNLGTKVLVRNCVPDRSWDWLAHFGRGIQNHYISFGADGNYLGMEGTENTFIMDNYFPRRPFDGEDELDASRYHGLYIDDAWQVTDWLKVYGGIRYEDYYANQSVDIVEGYSGRYPTGFGETIARFDESALLPKFGVTISPNKKITLFTHIARATRFPDNPAIYWYYAGYRPEVDPSVNIVRKPLTYEDAVEYEVGASFNPFQDMYLTITWFDYRIDDYIRWVFGYIPSRVVYNIDRVNIRGIEVESKARIWKNFSGFFNLTWQDTEKHGDVFDASNQLTDELSELPEWKINAGIEYENDYGFYARINLRWVDERSVPYLKGGAPDGTPLGTPVTLKKMDAFSVVDFMLRYSFQIGDLVKGSLSAGVENLLDEDYEEELDFPAPGRTFFISAQIKF